MNTITTIRKADCAKVRISELIKIVGQNPSFNLSLPRQRTWLLEKGVELGKIELI